MRAGTKERLKEERGEEFSAGGRCYEALDFKLLPGDSWQHDVKCYESAAIGTPAEAQIRGLSQVQFFPLSHVQTVAGAMRL